MNKPAPLKFGLIGGGRWAGVHRDALATVGADLVAVTVRSDDSRDRLADEWNVWATTDLDAMLARDLDAVIVASPNYLHAEHTVAALDAGKHVLVEKPMATTTEDCDRMLAAAERADRVLAVGLEMRVFTLFAEVKRRIDAGDVGTPRHLKLDLWRRPYRAGAGGWKSDPAKLGSAILEEPIHYLDLARWYFAAVSEPQTLHAWANSRPGRDYLRENLDVRLGFADGAEALVTRSIAAFEHHVALKLVGDDGALWATWDGKMDLDPDPRAALTLHSRSGTTSVEVIQKTGHAYDVPKQTQAFVDAIVRGTRPAADGDDGRASVALCLAVERSLEEGKITL